MTLLRILDGPLKHHVLPSTEVVHKGSKGGLFWIVRNPHKRGKKIEVRFNDAEVLDDQGQPRFDEDGVRQ